MLKFFFDGEASRPSDGEGGEWDTGRPDGLVLMAEVVVQDSKTEMLGRKAGRGRVANSGRQKMTQRKEGQ